LNFEEKTDKPTTKKLRPPKKGEEIFNLE